MANRKEDEKNERTIRSLLKLPENRRCINCNSLGPQYVCTNFWTFVCTTCSGIHREFTHRVKSVSMAKFNSQEVAALQAGGNARAKESLFKEWDPQRHSFPDSSNVEKLRDFIKHAYVDRRYTGDKSLEKPPKGKMGEESYENRRPESYHGGSRSPPYDDTYEQRRYNDRPSPGGRSDDSHSSYDQRRSPGYDSGKSPVPTEVVNDWRREDRFGNGNRKNSDVSDSRSEGRSPDYQKDMASPPPIVRPVRDILGDNVAPLRIEPPKVNVTKVTDSFANSLRTSSSSSLGSADGNPMELKKETLVSLIDFDVDPKPSIKANVQPPQQSFIAQPPATAKPTSTPSDANWASFEIVTEAKAPRIPSTVNSLESLFSQLSVPSSSVAINNQSFFGSENDNSTSTFTGGLPSAAQGGVNPSLITSGGGAPPAIGDIGQWSTMNNQDSLPAASGLQSRGHQFTPPVIASTTQHWNPSFAPNAHGISSNIPSQRPPQVVSTHGRTQPSHVETKSTGRTALPEDLFAATAYSSIAAPVRWQSGTPGGGMGYAMQYNTGAPIPTYPQPLKQTNPFDLNNHLPQAPSYPFMASMHSGMPNMQPPTGLLRTLSHETSLPAWLPPQSQSYASSLPPNAHMGQQLPNNMTPSWHQGGVGGTGIEGASFGSANSNQFQSGGYSAPSRDGNPFG